MRIEKKITLKMVELYSWNKYGEEKKVNTSIRKMMMGKKMWYTFSFSFRKTILNRDVNNIVHEMMKWNTFYHTKYKKNERMKIHSDNKRQKAYVGRQ